MPWQAAHMANQTSCFVVCCFPNKLHHGQVLQCTEVSLIKFNGSYSQISVYRFAALVNLSSRMDMCQFIGHLRAQSYWVSAAPWEEAASAGKPRLPHHSHYRGPSCQRNAEVVLSGEHCGRPFPTHFWAFPGRGKGRMGGVDWWRPSLLNPNHCARFERLTQGFCPHDLTGSDSGSCLS